MSTSPQRLDPQRLETDPSSESRPVESDEVISGQPLEQTSADSLTLPRMELALLGTFSGAWLLAALTGLGVLPAAGTLGLDLYTLYSFGAALGWVAGNVYVARRRRLGPRGRKRLLLLTYLVGPPSLLYVLRSLAPYAAQNAAPLVPLYAFCVFGLFFLVPVTLRYRG